jgi:hypothetical protein
VNSQKSKNRYYNFVIRQSYKSDDCDFKRGDKFEAMVSPFVVSLTELFSFITKDTDKTFIIPCEFVKFAED